MDANSSNCHHAGERDGLEQFRAHDDGTHRDRREGVDLEQSKRLPSRRAYRARPAIRGRMDAVPGATRRLGCRRRQRVSICRPAHHAAGGHARRERRVRRARFPLFPFDPVRVAGQAAVRRRPRRRGAPRMRLGTAIVYAAGGRVDDIESRAANRSNHTAVSGHRSRHASDANRKSR
jgi:hypothetical protein